MARASTHLLLALALVGLVVAAPTAAQNNYLCLDRWGDAGTDYPLPCEYTIVGLVIFKVRGAPVPAAGAPCRAVRRASADGCRGVSVTVAAPFPATRQGAARGMEFAAEQEVRHHGLVGRILRR